MAKKNKNTEEAYKDLMTTLVINQAWLEAIDKVRETTYYRQTLKKAINLTEEEALKSLGLHFATIYNRDQNSFEILTESIQEIGKWIAHNSFEDVYALAEVMKKGELKFIAE